jgi:hypothetical protein
LDVTLCLIQLKNNANQCLQGRSSRQLFFLGGKEWNCFSGWPSCPEVQCCLLMTLWMLFAPQDQEQRGHFGHDSFRPMNLRVTARTEGDHQTKYRLPWYPVMNND